MKPDLSNINRKRGFTKFLTSKLLVALVKRKISDRDAIHIIIPTTEALGKNVSELIINRIMIQRDKNNFEKKKS